MLVMSPAAIFAQSRCRPGEAFSAAQSPAAGRWSGSEVSGVAATSSRAAALSVHLLLLAATVVKSLSAVPQNSLLSVPQFGCLSVLEMTTMTTVATAAEAVLSATVVTAVVEAAVTAAVQGMARAQRSLPQQSKDQEDEPRWHFSFLQLHSQSFLLSLLASLWLHLSDLRRLFPLPRSSLLTRKAMLLLVSCGTDVSQKSWTLVNLKNQEGNCPFPDFFLPFSRCLSVLKHTSGSE